MGAWMDDSMPGRAGVVWVIVLLFEDGNVDSNIIIILTITITTPAVVVIVIPKFLCDNNNITI